MELQSLLHEGMSKQLPFSYYFNISRNLSLDVHEYIIR